MSNIVALDNKLADINVLSKTKVMQMVFDDLRTNRPKPLAENWDLKTLRIHTKCVSMPNMAFMSTKSLAKAPEVEWRSTPNLKLLRVISDIQRPEPSGRLDSKSLVEGRLSVSTLNISVRLSSSAGDAPELLVSDTTQDTDGGPVTEVNNRRPRRSFWRRTRKFVKRLFCCGSVEMIDQ